MELKGLEPEEAAVFEWQYGYCGDFRKELWKAIMHADTDNLRKLSLGFPIEVEGYKLYVNGVGWWGSVQDKAVKLGYIKSRD